MALSDLKAGRDMKAPPRFFVEEAQELGAPELRGVKIEDLLPNSVAEQAKLQVGDVVVAVNGMDTHSWPALVRVLKAHLPGDMVEITYQRGAVTHRAQAILNDPAKKGTQ
jgi:S1-C subfamily serine protease